MHESGLIRKLIQTALDEAGGRNGQLRGIYIRLGALAGGTASHMREHFEIETRDLGLRDIELHITEAPEHPAGIELTGIELAERQG